LRKAYAARQRKIADFQEKVKELARGSSDRDPITHTAPFTAQQISNAMSKRRLTARQLPATPASKWLDATQKAQAQRQRRAQT